MMDKFFRTQFQPDTGMWIRTHPEIKNLNICTTNITKLLDICYENKYYVIER